MKVRIYAGIVLTGPTQAGGTEIETDDEMIWVDCSLPALPRIGEIVELHDAGQNFATAATVEGVNWFPDENKTNVFFPVVYLEKDDYFDKKHGFALGTTVEEKRKVLKELVVKTHDRKRHCLKFDCNG
ncbi:MAG: hypothetical protein EXS46_02470 [Candidatus Taylorbacteria bacterium]|nr:hypothetical protein [Candidatus Taylorbacteria bacterium]